MEAITEELVTMLYGDNHKIIFGTYVFVWEDTNDVAGLNGTILAANGGKLIKEKIDNVAPIKSGYTNEIIGYAIFLQNQLKRYYDAKHRLKNQETDKILVITNECKLRQAKLIARPYSNIRPELVIHYDFISYLGKFKSTGELVIFESSS